MDVDVGGAEVVEDGGGGGGVVGAGVGVEPDPDAGAVGPGVVGAGVGVPKVDADENPEEEREELAASVVRQMGLISRSPGNHASDTHRPQWRTTGGG